MKIPTRPISFRLSEECLRMIATLEKRWGLKRSAVIEFAVRQLSDEKPKRKTYGGSA